MIRNTKWHIVLLKSSLNRWSSVRPGETRSHHFEEAHVGMGTGVLNITSPIRKKISDFLIIIS